MADKLIEAVREATTELFRGFCSRHDLTLMTRGGDKHGSYVWEAGADILGLSRYITLGLTPDAMMHQAVVPLLVSNIIGADDGRFYTNQRMREYGLRDAGDYFQNLQTTSLLLESAWQHALAIGPDMLSKRYPVDRGQTQESETFSTP